MVRSGVEDCGGDGAVACKSRTEGNVAKDRGGESVILGLLGQCPVGGQERLGHRVLSKVEERQAAGQKCRLCNGHGELLACSPGG